MQTNFSAKHLQNAKKFEAMIILLLCLYTSNGGRPLDVYLTYANSSNILSFNYGHLMVLANTILVSGILFSL